MKLWENIFVTYTYNVWLISLYEELVQITKNKEKNPKGKLDRKKR